MSRVLPFRFKDSAALSMAASKSRAAWFAVSWTMPASLSDSM